MYIALFSGSTFFHLSSLLIFSPSKELLNFSYFILGLKFHLLLLYSGLKFPFCLSYIFYFFRKTFYSFAETLFFFFFPLVLSVFLLAPQSIFMVAALNILSCDSNIYVSIVLAFIDVFY